MKIASPIGSQKLGQWVSVLCKFSAFAGHGEVARRRVLIRRRWDGLAIFQ